jgi:hypothetical protein
MVKGVLTQFENTTLNKSLIILMIKPSLILMVDTRNPNNYTNIYQWKTNTTPYASKFTLCFIRF